MRDSVWLLALGLLVVGGAALAVRNKAPPPPAIQPDGPVPYARPPWVPAAVAAPATRLHLAHLPTPVHRWRPPGASNAELYIKRDDCSGSELSGNKVRKLEFLLADAIAKDATAAARRAGVMVAKRSAAPRRGREQDD